MLGNGSQYDAGHSWNFPISTKLRTSGPSITAEILSKKHDKTQIVSEHGIMRISTLEAFGEMCTKTKASFQGTDNSHLFAFPKQQFTFCCFCFCFQASFSQCTLLDFGLPGHLRSSKNVALCFSRFVLRFPWFLLVNCWLKLVN